MLPEYDVIVVGGGHAGCEAALSAAKMGSTVLLVTMNLQNIAQMSCNPAMGALYLFVKVDAEKFNITNDEKMVLDLLKQEKILLVHGSAFNIPEKNYFRLVFLPNSDELVPAMEKLKNFFSTYYQL